MTRIVSARGTRPEALKMEPVESALAAAGADVRVWDSGQSPDLTGSTASAVIWNDGLTRGISAAMNAFRDYLRNLGGVDAVLVQGDTATAFACALTAFLEGIPVGHVEAGLRTYAAEPFPEEAFRRAIAPLARWHFCPDMLSRDNLQRELNPSILDAYWKPSAGIFVTGNPIVDALPQKPLRLLVTLHRRENWGTRIGDALEVLDAFCAEFGACATVIRHPNWTHAVPYVPENLQHLFLSGPVPHARLLEMLEAADLVLTDSGGLQEEAAHFGVPTLVLRTSTERKALERLGAVKVVNPDDAAELRSALEAEARKRLAYGARGVSRAIASILLDNLASDAEIAA